MEQPAPAVEAAAPPETLSVPDDKALLDHVEAFLARSGMKASRFGLEAMKEGGLVKSLRDGRSLSLKNANKVLAFIRAHDAKEAEAEATCRPFSSPSSAGPMPGRLLSSLTDGARAMT